MSGNPIPAFGTWATEANYPGGPNPWNGQPTKVQPSPDYWTPNTKPPAQYFNYVFGAIASDITALYAAGVTAAIDNWGAATQAVSLDSGTTFASPFVWDAFNTRWLGFTSGSSGTLIYSVDGGRSWNQPRGSGIGGTTLAVAVNPTTGDIVFMQSATSDVSKIANPGTGSVTQTDSTFVALNVATACWSTVDSKYYILLADDPGSGTFSGGRLITTPDGTTLTTFAPPSGWVSGTNHIGAFLSAVGPAITVMALCGATAGTDTARLMTVGTGGSMTDVTPSILGSKIVTGLAYDANRAVWLLLAYDGTSSTLYTTTTPGTSTSWALASTFTGAKMTGAAVLGVAWAVTGPNTVSAGNTVRVSTDQGATWHKTASGQAAVAALASSGNQLVAWGTANVIASGAVGLF